jgi:GntR family phosphonate transport system transcriptional regulator
MSPPTQSEYTRLADLIAAGIKAQNLRTGARLPTQQKIAQTHGVSRHIVRRALDLLEQRGVLGGRQGSGTYVRGKLVDYHVKSRTRYNDNVRMIDDNSSIELLEFSSRRATPELAKALTASRQARIFDLYIQRWTGDEPLCVARHIFPAARFPDLHEHVSGITGISELLGRLGIADFKRSDTAISARNPTREEARLLRLPFDSPVVVLEGRNVDAAGIPVELSTSIWPASRIRVHV